MSDHPLDDIVSNQYERWIYPEPITDLPAWLQDNWQWFDPSHSSRLFWPAHDTPRDLDILVAGCGANQAAVLAATNLRSRVVGIDVSEASLAHHQWLKERYGLDNLELRQLPIEEVETLGRDFDLIVSTGVLHHLEDPAVGLTALGRCLRLDGVAAIMLYARYGRIGVELIQGVFRDLGLVQDEPSLEVVKATIAALPEGHPLQDYLAMAPDLQFDAGIVDTFLHGRDRSYTTGDCLELVAAAGLVFDDWFLKSPYVAPSPEESPFAARLATLPREQQWSVLERVYPRNACHFLTACRPERPEASYRIDLAGPDFDDYVPSLRHRCWFDGATVGRPDWSVALVPAQQGLVQLMDGRRSIGELIDAASAAPALAAFSDAGRTQYARELFSSLWERDVLAFALPTA